MARLLDAFADGELGRTAGRRLRLHLGACATCREELACRVAVIQLVRRTALPRVPSELHRRIQVALDCVDSEHNNA